MRHGLDLSEQRGKTNPHRDKGSRDWCVAGQSPRPGKGDISPDPPRNNCRSTSLKRLEQQGNRQRNETRGRHHQGTFQTHFRKNEHHVAHRNGHEDCPRRITTPCTSNSLTTGDRAYYEWYAQRVGGIILVALGAVPRL